MYSQIKESAVIDRRAAVRDGTAERRREARYRTADRTAQIVMTKPDLACEGVILDVSRSGMRLRTNRYLEVEGAVTLHIGHITVTGRICRCTVNQDRTFDIGVLICDIDLA